jgi:hypothetical protein
MRVIFLTRAGLETDLLLVGDTAAERVRPRARDGARRAGGSSRPNNHIKNVLNREPVDLCLRAVRTAPMRALIADLLHPPT